MSTYTHGGQPAGAGGGDRHSAHGALVFRIMQVVLLILVGVALRWVGSDVHFADPLALIAERHSGYLTPGPSNSYVWFVLLAGLATVSLYQILPTAAGSRAGRRVGVWWFVIVALHVGWVALLALKFSGAALMLAITLLVVIGYAGGEARRGHPHTVSDALFVTWPLDAYLAWVWAACVTNFFLFANQTGVTLVRSSEREWAVVALLISCFASGMLAWVRGNWWFSVITALVLQSVAQRQVGVPWVETVATVCAMASLVAGVIGWWNSAPAKR